MGLLEVGLYSYYPPSRLGWGWLGFPSWVPQSLILKLEGFGHSLLYQVVMFWVGGMW